MVKLKILSNPHQNILMYQKNCFGMIQMKQILTCTVLLYQQIQQDKSVTTNL